MKVTMIWARDAGITWLADAMDEESIMENSDAWTQKVRHAKKAYPEMAIVAGEVDDDFIKRAFEPRDEVVELTNLESHQS